MYKDRISQFPNRRRMKIVEELENGEKLVEIFREEGVVSEGGTPLNASTLTPKYDGIASESNAGHAKAGTALPLADGQVAVGDDNGKFARENHVHPRTILAAQNLPKPNGTANLGVSVNRYALEDHVHPSSPVIDNLESNEHNTALSAYQGKELNRRLTELGFKEGVANILVSGLSTKANESQHFVTPDGRTISLDKNNYLIKQGKMCIFELNCSVPKSEFGKSKTYLEANQAFARIPVGFRPRSSVSFLADFTFVDNSVGYECHDPALITVETNGDVKSNVKIQSFYLSTATGKASNVTSASYTDMKLYIGWVLP